VTSMAVLMVSKKAFLMAVQMVVDLVYVKAAR
jgi:hypothetical protein